MKFKLLLTFCLIILSSNVFSQNIYETKLGTVIIYYQYNDSTYSSISKDLFAKINYDNTNIKMTLKLKTLNMKHDSLIRSMIPNFENITVTVEGKTSLVSIDTKKHLPQSFSFNGILKAEKLNKKITGKGNLTHLSDRDFPASCYLSMQFNISLSDFKINASDYLFKDNIYVEIIQSILKKR